MWGAPDIRTIRERREEFSACLTKIFYRPCSESLLELVLDPDPDELESSSSSSSSESSELELLLALSREEHLLPRPAMLPVGVALLPGERGWTHDFIQSRGLSGEKGPPPQTKT